MSEAAKKIVFMKAEIGPLVCYAERAPAEETRPIVAVLPGSFRSGQQLLPLAPLLSEAAFLFFDLRGHGLAKSPEHRYRVEDFAADLKPALEKLLGARSFALIGESYAGLVAAELAIQGMNISQVIMLDTPLDTNRSDEVLAALRARLGHPSVNQDMLKGFSRDIFGLDLDSGEVSPRRFHDRVRQCPVPILLITGGRKAPVAGDGRAPALYRPEDAERLGLPPERFRVIEIPGVGHKVADSGVALAAVLRDALGLAGGPAASAYSPITGRAP